MATNLTLKNIPEEVYEQLKRSAELHRRSLNSEAIRCLEAVLLPSSIPPSERLARARAIREMLPKKRYSIRQIDAAKRQDRP
jgi:plasmid stability protein